MRIFFDPSIRNIGWAVYSDGGKYIMSGHFKTPERGHDVRLASIYRKVYAMCSEIVYVGPDGEERITGAVVEVTGGFSYTRHTGRHGKALNQKSLQINSMAAGVIIAACACAFVPVAEVTAHEWKGGRVKDFDLKAAMRICGKDGITDHEADAIMLGWWWGRKNRFTVHRSQFTVKKGQKLGAWEIPPPPEFPTIPLSPKEQAVLDSGVITPDMRGVKE